MSIASSAESILQSVVNQVTSFITWTLGLLLKATISVLEPISIFMLLIGIVLWFSGLERRMGKRLVLGALIIWLVALVAG
jgi:hypothetical protein